MQQRCTIPEWEQLKALTNRELVGQDRLELILARGFYLLIKAWAPKSQVTLESLMDCMLDTELDESRAAAVLDRACGDSSEADPADLAEIEALMAKWN